MKNTSKNFGHLMLDIETMGNVSYSAIVSIGAVEFDIETAETGREFHERIDLQSCIDAGLIINADTIMWWMGNSDEARAKLSDNPQHINIVLQKFHDFLNEMIVDVQIWGNAARFDLGLVQNAYNKINSNQWIPWNMRKERDVRTLVSFAPEIKEKMQEKEGIFHDALEDCKQQIRYCSEIWNKLNL